MCTFAMPPCTAADGNEEEDYDFLSKAQETTQEARAKVMVGALQLTLVWAGLRCTGYSQLGAFPVWP